MKMMAQRLYAPRDMRYEQTELPELGPHDVRIKVKCCGICGTDYSIYSGEASFWEDGLIKTPMTFGHEYCGVVDAVGSDVTKFKPGDRVVSDTAISCNVCEQCLAGNYLKCEHQQSVGTVNCKDGGYAEYTVMPERHVFALADNVSFEEGALVEPVSTAMYACMRAGISMSDTVLILGTGPIGLGAIQPAKLMGASKVVIAGRKPKKLAAAKKLGADYVIDMTAGDINEAIARLTENKGFDRIIEATGSHDMLRLATEKVKAGGAISAVAFYDKKVSDINVDRIVLNDITFAGSAGSANIAPKVLRLMAEGKIDATPMITHRVNLQEAKGILDNFRKNSADTIKALIVFE